MNITVKAPRQLLLLLTFYGLERPLAFYSRYQETLAPMHRKSVTSG